MCELIRGVKIYCNGIEKVYEILPQCDRLQNPDANKQTFFLSFPNRHNRN